MMENTEKRNIAILGSTGSIGTQALDVIKTHNDRFAVYAITGNNNVELLIRQAREFLPLKVIISNEQYYQQLKEALSDLPIEVCAGAQAIDEMVQEGPIDMVLTAMVGYAGLRPTIQAIKAGKPIALANKETMVVAGEIINELARIHKVPILPVDSEHSAIFQCLEMHNPVEKIILTASGGPFRKTALRDLVHVTKKEALKHPNWDMGAKITIDSATMMNKGFEVIEAKWLFHLNPDQIQVVVHPQSIIHSMVQFKDGSIKAQMGLPDMKLPILYAFSFPERLTTNFPRLDFQQYATLTFEEPDLKRFRNLQLAYKALSRGGTMPCTVNAANEIAVDAFLKDRIGFLEMSDVIEKTMAQTTFAEKPTYEDYVAVDAEARVKAQSFIY